MDMESLVNIYFKRGAHCPARTEVILNKAKTLN